MGRSQKKLTPRKLFIPILEGTTRPKRESIHVAKLVLEVGKEIDEIEVKLIDPSEFNFPFDGEDEENKDARYSEITKRADAFMIVTPEYNHSFPGSLKRMLDSELENYIHKPVAFVSVSSQMWGGVRAIEALVTTVRELGLAATFTDTQFPKVGDLFDQEGKLLDERYRKRVKRTWDELIWMAKTFKYGRENFPNMYHVENFPAVGKKK